MEEDLRLSDLPTSAKRVWRLGEYWDGMGGPSRAGTVRSRQPMQWVRYAVGVGADTVEATSPRAGSVPRQP